MQKVIEKIHKKFDTAGEKLLKEAKRIVSEGFVVNSDKVDRFMAIGFTSAKIIKDKESDLKKQQEASETIEAIEYYSLHYPNYKFISEKQIEKISKKYGLLYGAAKNYLGDIPDKNLAEIEAFKLRQEDYYEDIYTSLGSMVSFWYENTSVRAWPSPEERGYMVNSPSGIIAAIKDNSETVSYPPVPEKPPFKICAPKKDFNTQGYEVIDGYKLVYDPIVIQPVKYKSILGGLIISKWGLEGQDAELVNEKMN